MNHMAVGIGEVSARWFFTQQSRAGGTRVEM